MTIATFSITFIFKIRIPQKITLLKNIKYLSTRARENLKLSGMAPKHPSQAAQVIHLGRGHKNPSNAAPE